MLLVNETNVSVSYTIASGSQGDCGTIDPNGVADLPTWDNMANVTVYFTPVGSEFRVDIPKTQTGNQVEVALLFT